MIKNTTLRNIVSTMVLSAVSLTSCSAQSAPPTIKSHLIQCVINGPLPDSSCTPGAIFPAASTTQICRSGYASSVRNVTQAVKDQIYQEYGIATHKPGEYEIDHLISLELGGSNDIKNLWPESYQGKYNAHVKDNVENMLHTKVCDGTLSLSDAQKAIAANWVSLV